VTREESGPRPARIALAAAALLVAALAARSFGGVYVQGGSMEPTLVPGDLVVYRRAPVTAVEGDVVLIARKGWPAGVLHRVVAAGVDGTYTTRGDANPTPDRDPVPPGRLLGRAVISLPSGRVLRALVAASRWCYTRYQSHSARR
jgi:signal peptidase I